jgi:hypothetical protein
MGTESKLDRALATVCENCPVCRRARQRQSGAAYRLVRQVETKVCPFCRAYERVHGRKAHERTLAKSPPVCVQ